MHRVVWRLPVSSPEHLGSFSGLAFLPPAARQLLDETHISPLWTAKWAILLDSGRPALCCAWMKILILKDEPLFALRIRKWLVKSKHETTTIVPQKATSFGALSKQWDRSNDVLSKPWKSGRWQRAKWDLVIAGLSEELWEETVEILHTQRFDHGIECPMIVVSSVRGNHPRVQAEIIRADYLYLPTVDDVLAAVGCYSEGADGGVG